ncbi:response regulator [Domibacillus sp. A3M-37]|uniref:response regulator transcription factor n=1 Tax=Domibacillus TaxID=1433999 RepID=UPI000617B9DE|nr:MULTISPECIES: response regulator [Domibacillus]MCP3761064.1 response regulator [Domibacillus sp. A3M-37]
MKKILVADDEEILRMLIVDTLEDDFDITEAEDGQEALHHIQTQAHDLIILDYMMPHFTGMEVLETIRKNGVSTPVLMLTAKAQEADRELAMSRGADYFMAKPFSPIELMSLVQSILD